ncbi:glutathione S-transferase T3-like [Salvia miltiorrhiza]|uniref:glutathione S-transferase T3-like n=1 Tax=Salvia miltiorrhiza TaxID=226208 RepID=UPI0025AC7C99|nr:glutathione S-transferase T3-like [Salvia miltiorrhiza]
MSSNFPQQFPFNSPGGLNFSQQFPFNSPTGSSFHPQFSSNFPSTYFMPPPNQFQENNSQFPQHSSQIPIVDDDVEEVGKSTAKTKETKAAWSPDEDILLIKDWYNTSTDSIIGNQQKRKDFWEKITAYYNEWKPEGTAARSLSQVKNHYYRLNPDLNKWAGIYNNFWSNRVSGQGDDDVLEAAKRA